MIHFSNFRKSRKYVSVIIGSLSKSISAFRYYFPAAVILSLGLPVALSCYLGESFSAAFNGNLYRYVIGLHVVWMVNSVAHLWGSKPYDK